jgi:phage terminase large subunit-like protein
MQPSRYVTTTPPAADVLQDLLAMDTTVVTHAPTQATRNRKSFLKEVEALAGRLRGGRD